MKSVRVLAILISSSVASRFVGHNLPCFFFLSRKDQIGPRPSLCEVYRPHTSRHTHTHRDFGPPLDERSARRRGRYQRSAQQTQETNILALSRLRTRNYSNQAAADLCLRPHSHPGRHIIFLVHLKYSSDFFSVEPSWSVTMRDVFHTHNNRRKKCGFLF